MPRIFRGSRVMRACFPQLQVREIDLIVRLWDHYFPNSMVELLASLNAVARAIRTQSPDFGQDMAIVETILRAAGKNMGKLLCDQNPDPLGRGKLQMQLANIPELQGLMDTAG